jgi:hypothetical protein
MKKNSIVYNILWLVIALTGAVLLVLKIVYESEPGALPIMLIIIGAAGLLIRRFARNE